MREARQREAYRLSRELVAMVYDSTRPVESVGSGSPTRELRRAAVSAALNLLAASRTDDQPGVLAEAGDALSELGRLIDRCRQRGVLSAEDAGSLQQAHRAAATSWRRASEA